MEQLFRLVGLEDIVVLLTESPVTFCKGFYPDLADTVHMPERIRVIHPFFTSILADRAVKEFVYTGICVVQKSDQVCFCSDLLLHKEAELSI